jgi:uncharacterized protein with gpF-like domain
MILNAHIGNKYDLRAWIAKDARATTSDEARATYWRGFEAQREAFYPWAIKQVRAQFRHELQQIKGRANVGASPQSFLDLMDGHAKEWKGLLKRIHHRVGMAFAKRTHDTLSGKSVAYILQTKAVDDAWYNALMAYIEKTVGDKVIQILGTTKDLIKAAIREGIANGEGVYEVSQRIEKLYLEQIIPHRAEVIARTETIAASGAGSRAAAVASGLNLTHEWVDSHDERVRPTHSDADGQVKPLDEPFEVGSSLLMFPGDASLGADGKELIQCRCVEVYAVVR